MTCPVCGAKLSEGATCQALFDELLVLEFTDPGYGAVHFLTVACFMIQHERYSDAGLGWIVPNVRAYLDEEMTNEQIRRRARRLTDSGTRTWKVLRAADDPPLPKIAWTMTMAEVAGHYADAEEYGQRIRQWARSSLRDLDAAGLPPK